MKKNILAILVLFSLNLSVLNNVFAENYGINMDDYNVDMDNKYGINMDDYNNGNAVDVNNYLENKEVPSVIESDYTISLTQELKNDITVKNGATLTIGMSKVVNNNITLEKGSSLILDNNSSVKGNVIVKDAKEIKILMASTLNNIKGTAENLSMYHGSTINNLDLSISGNTNIGINSIIKNIYLKTNNLNISNNSSINNGNVYVYGKFEGGVNGKFEGKITIYSNSEMGINSEHKGNYCTMGLTKLGINGSIKKYPFNGLYGNLYPILNFKYLDNSSEAQIVKNISLNLDRKFSETFSNIFSKNRKIANLKKVGNKESEISSLVSEKENIKKNFLSQLTKTLNEAKPYVDENKNNQRLFNSIQKMYSAAISKEDKTLVYKFCSNSINYESYNIVKDNKIILKNKEILRKNVLNSKQQEAVLKSITKFDENKILDIDARINKILNTNTGLNNKTTNLIFDLKELLKNSLVVR